MIYSYIQDFDPHIHGKHEKSWRELCIENWWDIINTKLAIKHTYFFSFHYTEKKTFHQSAPLFFVSSVYQQLVWDKGERVRMGKKRWEKLRQVQINCSISFMYYNIKLNISKISNSIYIKCGRHDRTCIKVKWMGDLIC